MIARPTGGFAQDVVVAVGSNDGVAIDAPVVTQDGFLGRVTRVYSRSARVTLLTDEQLAVSALDVKSGAAGIVKHGRASASTLIFDRVPKKLKVSVGDTIVTAGWRSSKLASLYPRGIPIGRVTSVGQADTDLWKQVQVEPFADFDRVDAVLVLVRKDSRRERRRRAQIALIVFVVAILQVSAFSSSRSAAAVPTSCSSRSFRSHCSAAPSPARSPGSSPD